MYQPLTHLSETDKRQLTNITKQLLEVSELIQDTETLRHYPKLRTELAETQHQYNAFIAYLRKKYQNDRHPNDN